MSMIIPIAVKDLIMIVIGVLAVSSLLCLVRAIVGPSGPDRVVSIDALTGLTIAILALIAVHEAFELTFLMDVALVYALLAFLGGVAVSKYLEGKELGE